MGRKEAGVIDCQCEGARSRKKTFRRDRMRRLDGEETSSPSALDVIDK